MLYLGRKRIASGGGTTTVTAHQFTNNVSDVKMDGVASLGVLDTIVRADHVHPFSDAETFAEAERIKSNNTTYGAIVHQKEMEGFAQPLAKYNEFIDINSSTLTTLAEYLTYFKQNYPKCFKVRIGAAETSNFKSVVGTPTGFGNYVNCFIHPKQQGTSTGASGFFELYAVNGDGSHFATGYMGEVYQSATDTYKYFTGWHIIL